MPVLHHAAWPVLGLGQTAQCNGGLHQFTSCLLVITVVVAYPDIFEVSVP